MKNIILIALCFLPGFAFGCPACEKAQPELLRGVTHGAGPDSSWDYLIVSVTAAIVLLCMFLTCKLLIKPGEKNFDHIKNQILN